MKKNVILLTAIALSLTMGTTVVADSTNVTNHKVNRLVEKFDVDQDGSIAWDEVQLVLTEKFTKADADGDGFITSDEMLTVHEQLHQERTVGHFAELDSDESGSLSLEEFQAGGPSASPFSRKGFFGSMIAKRLFSRLDQNDDGLLSKTETITIPLKIFEHLDKDQNGVISTEELAQMPPFGPHGGDRYHGKQWW